jgi:hypothetical protein
MVRSAFSAAADRSPKPTASTILCLKHISGYEIFTHIPYHNGTCPGCNGSARTRNRSMLSMLSRIFPIWVERGQVALRPASPSSDAEVVRLTRRLHRRIGSSSNASAGLPDRRRLPAPCQIMTSTSFTFREQEYESAAAGRKKSVTTPIAAISDCSTMSFIERF